METEIITNEQTGEKIHLEKTDNLDKLKNQRILLGMKGLLYSPWGKEVCKKIKILEDKNRA